MKQIDSRDDHTGGRAPAHTRNKKASVETEVFYY
jgi:hypothetical protein